ncbi:MAG: hypothetical protein GY927_13995 [bacterium]|nr:hypothetical protein [bacterium]
MDAYNQGYGAGIKHNKTRIGTASLTTDSTREFRDPDAPEGTTTPDEVVDFYAAAYSYNGQTVISYRGTDDPLPDVNYRYSLGMGLPGAAQDAMALQFYKQVAGKESMGEDPRDSNIGAEITGTVTEITCFFMIWAHRRRIG